MPIYKRTASTRNKALCRAVAAELARRVSPGRLRHSRAVSRLAARLCARHGLDPELGRLAGLGHDLARELTTSEALALVSRHRLPAGKWERAHPVVLHGVISAHLMESVCGVRDREALEAVADHVLGRPGMGLLSRILFVADYLEPGRGFLPEKMRRAWLSLAPAAALVRVTEHIFSYLESEKKPIAPRSKKMYDYFKARVKE